MSWRSGPEIDATVDRLIFEMQIKKYTWIKTLSVLPRKCYLSGDIIRPLSYAMVAHCNKQKIMNATIVNIKEPERWISMATYIYLRLLEKI